MTLPLVGIGYQGRLSMPQCFNLIILLLFFSEAGSAALPTKTTMTLDDAKNYAIAHNFRLESYREEKEASTANRHKLRALFLPKLGVTGGLNSYMERSGELGPFGFGFLSYNLFNGYRDQLAFAIADLAVEKSELLLEQEVFNLGLDVELYFHTYTYHADLIALSEEAIAVNETHKDLIQKTKNSGLSSRADLMNFELKEALLRSDLELVKQNLAETRIELKKVLGDEIGAKVIPIGEISHQHLKGELMDYLNQLKNKSVPIKIAAVEEKTSLAQSTSWRASWLPKVDLEIRAGQLYHDAKVKREEYEINVLITGSLELFSGQSSKWEKKEKEALLGRDQNRVKDQILLAIGETETAYRRLKTIEKRVDLEEENVARSKTYYQSIKDEYLRGYKSSSDLAAAAEGLFTAKKRRIDFMYAFLMERLKLERSLGAKVDVEIVKK